jgi:hypothetical protein
MAVLKPFSKVQDEAKLRAASEVQPVDIPFRHPDFLGQEYSNGVTDYCFFLRSKTTDEVFPWNEHMASMGNIFYMPHFDLDLLNDPDYEKIVVLWARQGILPKGYGPKVEVPAPKKAVKGKTASIPSSSTSAIPAGL